MMECACPTSQRPDPQQLLTWLNSESREERLLALTLACPCRNRYYDRTLWYTICVIFQTCHVKGQAPDYPVFEKANHAIGTLQDLSRLDSRYRALLEWLNAQGFGRVETVWIRRQSKGTDVPPPKVTLREVPALIEYLTSEEAEDHQQALAALCPDRTHRYNRKVWCALLEACHTGTRQQREQASMAVERLRAMTRDIPQAQALLRSLQENLPVC